MYQVKLGIALVLVVVVGVLVFQNRDPVQTKLLFATLTMPHSILLFLTAAFGFLIGMAFTVWMGARRGPRRLP